MSAVGRQGRQHTHGPRQASVCHLHPRQRRAADRRYDPKLRKMSTNRIDYRGLLADEQMTGTVQRQAALLFRRLGCDKPHVGPGDRFADRSGVSAIVLMSLHVRLHIGWRHQANGVAERLEFARPMMRRGAGFNADQARWQLLEEYQHVAALELTTEDDIALRIDAVNLKNRLRDVQTDRRDRLHDLAPPNRGSFNSTHIRGTHVPVEEPSTASKTEVAFAPRASCRATMADGSSRGARREKLFRHPERRQNQHFHRVE